MIPQLLRVVLVIALSAVGAARALATEAPPERQAALKGAIEQQFKVSASRAGLVLVPRREISGVTTVEVADGSVSLDGMVVTGDELRRRLGSSAEPLMQLSYLDAGTLRRLFPTGQPSAEAPSAPAGEAAGAPAARPDEGRYRRESSARIRLGGAIEIAEDEHVTEAVVAIGGSVTVNGRVDDDVVAVGGSVSLGPRAVVRGDVTAVGGRVNRQDGAVVEGKINEVGISGPRWRRPGIAWHGMDWQAGRWFAFAGTVTRIVFVLLVVALLAAVAAGPVGATSQRAAASPWAALFVGFGVQVLFVPALVVIVIALVVSIVGIPLLVTVPLMLVGFVALWFVGFAGVAARVGDVLSARVGATRGTVTTAVLGVAAIVAVTVLARLVGLLPWPMGFAGGALVFVGCAIEYVAWTIGLGAGVMVVADWQRRPRVPPVPTP